MTVAIHIEGIEGCFSRVDKGEFKIGEYYRMPNGRIYFYHSDQPKFEFLPVLDGDIPRSAQIILLEET